MFKNDFIIATNGKFTFPNEGDSYMQAIIQTFVAVETVSVDYAIIQMCQDKKDYKNFLDDASDAAKEIRKLQKKVLDKANNFVKFIDTTFQFEYTDGEVKRIESKFFKKDIEKYAYAINKMFEYIFILTSKYNVPDEVLINLSDRAKKFNEKMHGNTLEIQIAELIFQAKVKILITNEHAILNGKAYGLIVVLYALKELINNIDLDKSKQITLEFNTANDELFFDASGNKKILNAIIDDTIIRVRDNIDYSINNDTFDRKLGHILYHMIKELIEKRYNK